MDESLLAALDETPTEDTIAGAEDAEDGGDGLIDTGDTSDDAWIDEGWAEDALAAGDETADDAWAGEEWIDDGSSGDDPGGIVDDGFFDWKDCADLVRFIDTDIITLELVDPLPCGEDLSGEDLPPDDIAEGDSGISDLPEILVFFPCDAIV